MLNEHEKEDLRMLVLRKLKDNADKFDTDAEIDSSLTYQENKNILLDKIDLFIENKEQKQTTKEFKMLQQLNTISNKTEGSFWDKIRDNIKVLVVVGDSGSGKTAFCFSHLEIYDKPVYFYKHPQHRIIEALGYNNIQSLSELSRLVDCVVYFDEPQISFPRGDKRTNDFFLMVASLARQNNITLVFSTSDTRWINKGLESYVSHWVLKAVDVNLVKQGSVIKKIIRAIMPLAEDELILEQSEYLFYSRQDRDFNGLHTFNKPIYYDDRLSKAYRNQEPKGIIKRTIERLKK